MSFLVDLGFTTEQINKIEATISEALYNAIIDQKKLVMANIHYLKELGIINYAEIFVLFYDAFLVDHSNFKEILNEYEVTDLVEKLNSNINVFEYIMQ